MKITKIFLTGMLLTGMLCSCQSFEEVERNPNQPTQAPASLILKGAVNDLVETPWNKDSRWNQFYTINYNYYGNNEYDWTTTGTKYFTLKNVVKMEEEAKTSTKKDLNPYTAMAKFMKAYYFVWMTQRLGDVPMTDALKGADNLAPKYNTQKEVYLQAFKWLDEANDDFAKLIAAGDVSMQGDIFFNNNLRQWQKTVNTFKMRVLVSLSKRENDTDLKLKERFAEVLNNPTKFPLMTAMSDNLEYRYNATFNKYPINPDNFGFDATRQQMSATHIDLLKDLKDPRLFFVAEPAETELKKGTKATDFEAFVGANPAEGLDNLATKALKGDYSFINRNRYYRNYTPENTIQIGYPELCFNIAEGLNRGWAAGNAADFYQRGIQAAIGFFGVKNGENAVTLEIRDGGKISSQGFTVKFEMSEYLNQANVKYAGNNADGLKQILTQKYLAFFMNSGMEAFYNWRRTGFPANFAKGGAGTGNSGVIPRRWLYPNSERLYNEANYKQAITAQFGSGTESINAELWILK